MKIDCQNLVTKIYEKVKQGENIGQVANYIPELAKVDTDQLGICLTTIDGQQFVAGDAQKKFSIQSIAKVLGLGLVFKLLDQDIWHRVGVEPSGTAFNSLIQLELESGIPRNPFINAGAIVICDMLCSHLANPKKDLLHFVRSMSNNNEIEYCEKIAVSEKKTGYGNYALINLLKSFGNIKNDVAVVIDFYFYLCSIKMTCVELAQTFLFLANKGVEPLTKKRILTSRNTKRMNAIMQTCGFYDEAGEFAYRVGLPGKSGVGGGIVAILPNEYSIAVWSPKLNAKGNSFRGMHFLELLTTETEESIF